MAAAEDSGWARGKAEQCLEVWAGRGVFVCGKGSTSFGPANVKKTRVRLSGVDLRSRAPARHDLVHTIFVNSS